MSQLFSLAFHDFFCTKCGCQTIVFPPWEYIFVKVFMQLEHQRSTNLHPRPEYYYDGSISLQLDVKQN